MKKKVTRSGFVRATVRLLMAGLLTFIAVALGKRVVRESNCTDCPGYGICTGSNDCDRYINKQVDVKPKKK